MTIDLILFLILALVAITTALGMLISTNAVYSALFLVLNFATVAVFYILLGAPFIAMSQVTVYAGAIMVLFVFVIMLLNAGAEQKRGRSMSVQLLGIPGFFGLLALLSYAILRLFPNTANVHFGGFTNGKAEDVGRALFTRYLLPFEVTSVLILIAIIGAIVLARKELE